MEEREQPEVNRPCIEGRVRTRPSYFHSMRYLLLSVPTVLLACSMPTDDATAIAAGAFSARTGSSVQLVDVRTPAEFGTGHLPNAVNLDWTGGQLEAKTGTLDKARPVLLYCASGSRSANAKGYLMDQGFTDVVDLEGGIQAWRSAGLPLEP